MGNSQSVLSHRKDGQSQPLSIPPSSDVPRISSSEELLNQPQSAGASDAVKGENGVATLAQSTPAGKRRSLLNFASLRKPPRPTVDMPDNLTNEGPSSYLSRHWRAGLRGQGRPRPTSVLIPSSSPTTPTSARRPSSLILSAPTAPTRSPNSKEKGKARDEPAVSNVPMASGTSAHASQLQSHGIDEAPPVLDSELPVTEEEIPLSEQVLLELRNLQQQKQQDTKNDDNGDMDTTLEPVGNTVPSLNEKEEESNVLEIAQAPTPSSTGPTVGQPVSSPALARLSDTLGGQSNETDTTALPNHIDTVGEPDVCSSSLPASLPEVPSTRSTDNNNDSNNSNSTNAPTRRPLPPTGTGTIVVVQGVVHTADVRQFQSAPPPPPPPPYHHRSNRSHNHRPPRTVSSTPALRNLFPNLSSSTRSSSQTRLANPQQPPSIFASGRNRFSSLTDTLRQRSRSRTPTPSAQNRNRSANITTEDYLGLGASDRDQSVLSLGLDNAAYDSESSTSLTETSSSVGAVVSTDDTSTSSLTIDPSTDLISRSRADRVMNSSVNDDASARTNGNTSSDDDADIELSPGSIEVLGTLLSVATAATAASLVNGTTEPLFNSSLANRLAEDNNTLAEPSRPPRSPNNNNPSDRMRSAWDNLRDRFSRTRRRNPEGDLSTEVDDTREQMVREMARAFNLDLGNGGAAAGSAEREIGFGGTPSLSDPLVSATSGNPEAPEGSFEQFLHNLQVDLRTALAENYAARRTGGSNATRRDGRPDPTLPSNTTSTESSQSQAQTETPAISTNSDNNMAEPSATSVPYQPRSPRSATIDLPPLPGAAELPNSNNGERPQARAITGQPGAGINWWRLYRFPPMVMASTSGMSVNGAASQASPNSNPTGLTSQSQSLFEVEQMAYDAEFTDQTAEVPQQPQSQSQSQQQESADGPQHVVPVIVVGLQSVPVSRTGPTEDDHFAEAEHVADGPAEPTRGRSWPARAASSASRAFSRMGRRNDDDSTEHIQHRNHENAEPRERHTGGGRTYLIFVIGGYYPPNHGIVTGADDMNSFEALWELAELIGQVKPQVASKEDIEQSGLEVIKASKLSEYESCQKVASNTTEKCLICLDEYEPEHDIRLLSCSHAFHRNCVDRWLEEGKNNCPACRSQGVRTVEEPSSL